MYFVSAAVILLASLALIVHVSLPYNKSGRASVVYCFILVFLRVFCSLNTSDKIPVIFITLHYIKIVQLVISHMFKIYMNFILIIQISHQPLHIYKIYNFTNENIKTLLHVSVLRPSSGSHNFLLF